MDIDDRIITFETYYDPMLAQIIKGKLEANGIQCFIADELILGIQPIWNQALGGIKIKVFERDLRKCKSLIASDDELAPYDENEPEHENNKTTTCPYCGSSNVRCGMATENKFGLGTMVLSFLTMAYPFYGRKAWHCFNCKRDFK